MTKYLLIALFIAANLLATSHSFGQAKSVDSFQQEIATVFTASDGLPKGRVNRIVFDEEGFPIAMMSSGNFIFKEESWKPYSGKLTNPAESLPPKIEDQLNAGNLSHIQLFQIDSKNRLWVTTDRGLALQENGHWELYTGAEGLPYDKFTCITAGINGEIWLGTKKGVIRADGKQFHYRASRRWLPDDYVNDIVVQADGTAWIATNKGVSRISFVEMSLDEKAEWFTQQVETRHVREGFVCQSKLEKQFDIQSTRYDISDNDGMYTAMYGASQAFRYAVTGDKKAKELANRSLKACKWLVDITHESGFPARVIVPVDWYEPVNEIYNSAYNERKQKGDPFWKQITPRFVKSKNGKYLWKCDTSSDELAGHYFFYAVYYDLVAKTPSEKKMVREVVADVTDHLVRNGFLLRDHDGEPTRWGNFSPEFLNSVWGWDQRGLNSMMMLSFLKVAEHITGEAKYAHTAQMLRDKHNYHINAMQSKAFYPPEDVVPWDNNLCLMSMYGLLLYEKDPELLMMYRESLEFSWMHISKQDNPFWNIIYAALRDHFNEVVETGVYSSGKVFPEAGPYAEFTANEFKGRDFHYEGIIDFFKLLPLDLIGYEMDNTHRLDIIQDPIPGQEPGMGWHVDGFALPINERGHVRQDRDAFVLHANEGNGYSEHEGTFYLLPYYMARYHGLIK